MKFFLRQNYKISWGSYKYTSMAYIISLTFIPFLRFLLGLALWLASIIEVYELLHLFYIYFDSRRGLRVRASALRTGGCEFGSRPRQVIICLWFGYI